MCKTEMKFDQYHIRLMNENDIDDYYKFAFLESDIEAMYYTGASDTFTKEQITAYVNKVVDDPTRYDFLILDDHKIVGELVLNEIENGNCHYRICIFNKDNFSRKIGFNATLKVLQFAFNDLLLESVELEVFPFNLRGIGLYKKLGFRKVKDLKDEEAENPYKDIIFMRLRKKDFFNNAFDSH